MLFAKRFQSIYKMFIKFRYNILYCILATLFSAGFLIANIFGARITSCFVFSLTAGSLVFPLTFLLSDLVTEIWGEKKARLMVISSFIFCFVCFFLQYLFFPIPFLSGVVVIASFISFGISQLLDIRLFEFLKKKTAGKHLWLRNQTSLLLSQFLDTLIVNSIILYWSLGLDRNVGIQVIMGSFLYKAFFSVATLPLFYLLVFLIRRILQSESYEKAL